MDGRRFRRDPWLVAREQDQQATFGAARVWVLPNPSGLNRAFDLAGLVAAYSELRAQIK